MCQENLPNEQENLIDLEPTIAIGMAMVVRHFIIILLTRILFKVGVQDGEAQVQTFETGQQAGEDDVTGLVRLIQDADVCLTVELLMKYSFSENINIV